MKSHYDIAVIGAGPAGMAAAITASHNGASTVLFDEQTSAGGQIYRGVAQQKIQDKAILGSEYYQGNSFVSQLRNSRVEHLTGATVWHVSPDREIGVSQNGVSHLIQTDQVIIATGAQERPFPIAGWTLPGVMGAGAAQIMLKASGITQDSAVFAGTGPLLYLVAYQYMKAGVPIKAILDTTPHINMINALPHLPAALTKIGALTKGRRWIKQLRAAGIPFIKGVQNIVCEGHEAVETIAYQRAGKWQKINTSHVFLHQGVVPNTNLAVAAGCKSIWSNAQLCWHIQTDNWYETDIAGIRVTGDGASINGAVAAWHSGCIASLGALHRDGFINADKQIAKARSSRKALTREKRIRPFLDAMFKPPKATRVPQDNAIMVCRCEEVTAGEIHDAISLGCRDANQLKSHTRCGMGPCQGRFCGLTASEIIAQKTQIPIAEMPVPRHRPMVKPLLLGELINLATEPSKEG